MQGSIVTTTTPPLMSVDALNERIRCCPFNSWLGLKVVSATSSTIELSVTWRDEMVGSPYTGNVHGGILASIIDAAGSYTVGAAIGRIAPTLDLRIDYHKGAKPGAIRALGRVLKVGKSIATVDISLFDTDYKLLASGRMACFIKSNDDDGN